MCLCTYTYTTFFQYGSGKENWLGWKKMKEIFYLFIYSKIQISYLAGNTSNMITPLKRHHPTVSKTGTRIKTSAKAVKTPPIY